MAQGSTLSPMLFNVFAEELIEKFTEKEIWSQMYADDIVLVCTSLSELHRAVNILNAWC